MKRNGLCSGAAGEVMKKWRSYLAEHPVDYHGDVDSLIDLLYCFFTEYEPVENADVHRHFTELENQLMLTAFDDILFTRFVDHIDVYSRQKIGFVMKCGLTFQERLGD